MSSGRFFFIFRDHKLHTLFRVLRIIRARIKYLEVSGRGSWRGSPKNQGVTGVSPLSILIADDSDAIRGILRRLIAEGAGECRICGEAVDGRDVIRKAAELRPDAILLDLSIPIFSGLEAAKILQRECPAADVIFMSAQEPSVLSRLAAIAHVSASISKPLLANELLPLLREIAARKNAGREAA